MNQTSERTKRIAKNSVYLYVRMFFTMLIALYTSRAVLKTLGVEDYGIYNVVGGLVSMFSLISTSLSSSTSRFLTFELGRGDNESLRRVFSTSLWVHIVLAAVVILLAETVGLWFLNTHMNISPSRMLAANVIYQASIVSFALGLFSVPYSATISSHERMDIFAGIGMLESVLKLMAVLFLVYVPFMYDKLIMYSILLMSIGIMMQSIYFIYCHRHFPECRLQHSFDRQRWKEISSFAGWNFIGCTAGLMKGQGVNILINLFFGTAVNAARGISETINIHVNSFAGNFMSAVYPQITKSYAAGDYSYTYSLVERGSRFSYYAILIVALPIILETDFILHLWLGSYPEHTVNFARLVLVTLLIDTLSNTLINLQSATGRIRNYQIAVGGMLLMNFPFSYICLKAGLEPEYTYVVAIFFSICCLSLRLYFLKRMTSFSPASFIRNVCCNVIIVTSIALIIPVLIHYYMSSGLLRFVISTIISILSTIITIYVVGCSNSEKKFLKEKFSMLLFKRFRV